MSLCASVCDCGHVIYECLYYSLRDYVYGQTLKRSSYRRQRSFFSCLFNICYSKPKIKKAFLKSEIIKILFNPLIVNLEIDIRIEIELMF